MCSPRLSYVYLSSFPICAVSVYPCARIPFAYDHHHHHHLFYLIFQLEEKQKAYIRSALFYPFVNTPMCIVLVVPLPSMAALASFSDPASSLHLCFVVTLLFANVTFLIFGLPLVTSYIAPQLSGTTSSGVCAMRLMRFRKRFPPHLLFDLW